jgi:hypothetical protein
MVLAFVPVNAAMLVLQAQGAAAALAADRELHPLRYMRWTPPQMAFLVDPSPRKLLCLGQQLGGKTTVGLADTIWRCLGEHPYQTLPPRPKGRAFQAWIVCYSHQQSLQIQAKLWALLPKDRLAKGTVYQGLSRGFRGKHTAIVLDNGATILIKTTQQGPEALASGTVDHVQVDEPTTQACWQELQGRLRRTNGTLTGTLTPINRPTGYLREEVEAGTLSYHRYDLTQANATPQGSQRPLCLEDGTPITDAWIAELRARTPEAVRGVVLDGQWETRGVARYFSCFVADPRVSGSHVSTSVPPGDVELRLGIDHGDRPGKQIAVLLAIQHFETRGDVYADRRVAVWVLDEYTDPTGLASPADDARGILDMLARHGQTWTDLHYVMGDRVHMPGSARQKSNKDLSAQLSRLLGVPRDSLRPAIYTVKKSRGNLRDYVGTGGRWIYQCMAAPGGFHVHPRCESVIWALNSWTGPGPDCPEKDPVDALRYGLETMIFGGIKAGIPEIVSR